MYEQIVNKWDIVNRSATDSSGGQKLICAIAVCIVASMCGVRQVLYIDVKKDSETTTMFATTRSERHAPKVGREE